MIDIEHPLALWLAVPWLVAGWWFAIRQLRAVEWLRAHVSERFRALLSAYSARSLRWHLFLLIAMGLLLIVAGGRPTISGRGEGGAEGGRVLLIFDGSASMKATDVEGFETRFEMARQIAAGLVTELGDYRFALASYSGVATFHLPTTGDRTLFEEALRTIEVHNFYQNTGSSLTAALDAVFNFIDDREPAALQVVLLSDGELPFPEEYDEPLKALAEREISVHTVAIGSAEGEGRLIFDFNDVVAKKEEPRVLREYKTRRVDDDLSRISKRTGGLFTVGSAKTVEALAGAITGRPAATSRIDDAEARTDLAVWPLGAFFVLFLLDSLVIFQHRRRPGFEFDVERLGEPRATPAARRKAGSGNPALSLLAVVVLGLGCDSPLWWAYKENEAGITNDGLGRHEAARRHYERSIGYRIRPEVPTYNLARSATLREDYAEAHDLYQQALLLDPELAEAYFNDGIALFRWGEAERDPRGCELARTLDLWRQALGRFETTIGHAGSGELAERARAGSLYLSRKIAELKELVANPPAECAQPPPESSAAGGGEGGGGGGDGGNSPPPPSGSPPPGAAPPPSGGASGDSPAGEPPPLGGDELEQIRQELERIAGQSREPGKFHRRTGPEQFGKESWSNPQAEIWW